MAILDLKNYIISEMQSSIPSDKIASAESMHNSIARALTKYMTTNVTVDVESHNSIYYYNYTWEITGNLTSLPVPSSFSNWLSNLSLAIRSSFYLIYNDEGNDGYIHVYPLGNQSAFPTCNVNIDQSDLATYHESNYDSPYEGLMGIIADSICSSLLVSGNQDITPSDSYYGNFKITKVNL